MDPTRPLDGKRSPTLPGARAVGPGAKAPPASGTSTTSEVGEASAIVSTHGGGALEVARHETARIDNTRLAELAERIDHDRYDVDPAALADRILDDALGSESAL